MDSLEVHPGWDDGRGRSLFYRIDGTLVRDGQFWWTANITWDDDSEHNEGPHSYYDAVLSVEVSPHPTEYVSDWVIRDWPITLEEAALIAKSDPKDLLKDKRILDVLRSLQN